MRVEVRLFALFREGRFKRRTIELPEQTPLRHLLEELGILEEEVSIPLVNGRYSNLDRQLCANDVVSVFPAVGGG